MGYVTMFHAPAIIGRTPPATIRIHQQFWKHAHPTRTIFRQRSLPNIMPARAAVAQNCWLKVRFAT